MSEIEEVYDSLAKVISDRNYSALDQRDDYHEEFAENLKEFETNNLNGGWSEIILQRKLLGDLEGVLKGLEKIDPRKTSEADYSSFRR